MLIEEKRIMKMILEYEEEDFESLKNTLDIINFLIENFESGLVKEIYSSVTGESINRFDLYKVKGIINGLLTNREWLVEDTEYNY